MKHTPGPWYADIANCNIFAGKPGQATERFLGPIGHARVELDPKASVHNPPRQLLAAEAWANANLMAAAPDLLAACKLAIDEWSSDPLDPLGRRAAAERFIRMAIDKGAA